MESAQSRLQNAPEPQAIHASGEVSPTAERLADALACRGALHLDRYGLVDLADQGLSRTEVFRSLYELIATARVEIRVARLGYLVLCLPAPVPAPSVPEPPAAAARPWNRPRERRAALPVDLPR